MSIPAVRRIRADEWPAVRALRLESTSDPDAAIAFLETPEQVAARTDDFWRDRTLRAAESEIAAQFVAEADGAWVGSLSVLIRATGQTDHLGRFVDDRRADAVGVYVSPGYRGTGTVDALFDAAAAWVASQGLTRLTLDVHADNARAQAAYRRNGFTPTGVAFTGPIGPEIEMARTL
ncbi:GNAT family N-acetyltransferase [Microbacterium sp. NPDC058389]|uniref:GNAT family N-acetyltransferase n=1 Tax=Microbacterium sp. NPDC058389 TaxID=3346475 RepID=UPI00364A6C7A